MDRRSLKTRNAIRKAYFSLLAERPSHITVAEIARRANIDRKTFYLHYDIPEDVLDEFAHEKMEELRTALKNDSFSSTSSQIVFAFHSLNKVLEQDMELYRNVAKIEYDFLWNEVQSVLSETIYDIYCEYLDISEGQASVMVSFYSGGIISAYRSWLKGEIRLSLEEVAEHLAFLSAKGIEKKMK